MGSVDVVDPQNPSKKQQSDEEVILSFEIIIKFICVYRVSV